jgi:hypothetical protein
MRNLLIILAALLLTTNVFANIPEKISYQAVIRDKDGSLITKTVVSVRVSILQFIEIGSPIYVENHVLTTNKNGLISLEIGKGTSEGDFSSINWANGPYFIKTDIDPKGATNFTISATSQLLSVPYALHSKTADSLAGGINGSETKIKAGTNVIVSGKGTTENPYIVNSTIQTYAVGDYAQGGVVFWVDKSGQHGLAAIKMDQSEGTMWMAGSNGNTRAKGDGIYAGKANTTLIIASQMLIGDDGEPYAASICEDLSYFQLGTNYGDWYLPSKEELNIMFKNKAIIDSVSIAQGGNAMADTWYWSSTEYDNNYAYAQYFGHLNQLEVTKNAVFRVRAIRSF